MYSYNNPVICATTGILFHYGVKKGVAEFFLESRLSDSVMQVAQDHSSSVQNLIFQIPLRKGTRPLSDWGEKKSLPKKSTTRESLALTSHLNIPKYLNVFTQYYLLLVLWGMCIIFRTRLCRHFVILSSRPTTINKMKA